MSRASRRYYRTIGLGVAAMGTLIWAAMDQFGISQQEMMTVFMGTLVIAGVTILCAALITVLWVAVRKVWRRRESD